MGDVLIGTAWVGGQPSSRNRTQLFNLAPTTPYCYRPEGTRFTKTYHYATKGQDTKFKPNNADYLLQLFAEDALDHMETYGMDSVFWYTDPADTTRARNVLKYHSRFTTSYVAAETAKMRIATDNPKYDKYKEANLRMSRMWLLNSLDPALTHLLRPRLVPEMSGPEVWMLLVSMVQSDSVRCLRKRERALEKLTLKSYPGANVKLMNKDILVICNELEVAGMLPDNIILTIVEIFVTSEVETFRINFIARHREVENYLQEIAGKDESVIAAMPSKITYRSLTNKASHLYQILLDLTQWGPASNAGDKGAAPAAFMTKVD